MVAIVARRDGLMRLRYPAAGMRVERTRPERTLRIIAGRWRGRKFRFPPLEIRPTPDRVRETLFNWLAPRIEGARCLDLFAGSGALGLEALSRSAAEVIFIEQQRIAAAAIQRLLADWGAAGGEVRCDDAVRYLSGPPLQRFNVAFVDPPYGSGALARCAGLLAQGWLAPGARIYVEHARREPVAPLPEGWELLRSGTAGEVGYHLYSAG
jgi:16S rRNA (guanine966-N2)-methyltransferase